jgi:RNA-binding protein
MTEKCSAQQIQLTGKEKKYLRGLGHHITPTVYVGREGVTTALLKSAEAALKAHELIKVKLGQNCPLGKKQASEQLAVQCGAALVQLIGKTVLLYLPNTELPKDKRIRIITAKTK